MTDTKTTTEHFDCNCYSPEHTVRFMLDPGYLPDDKDHFGMPPDLYAELQLNLNLPWYKRLVAGLRYIFGRSASGSHWDCWIMKPSDTERLQKLLAEYNDQYNTWEKSYHERNADK
jgi:hypothetical protein